MRPGISIQRFDATSPSHRLTMDFDHEWNVFGTRISAPKGTEVFVQSLVVDTCSTERWERAEITLSQWGRSFYVPIEMIEPLVSP